MTLLSRAVARDSLPASLLLAGPAGVGKRTTAMAIAQALNCRTPVVLQASADTPGHLERDACGECPSCSRIVRGLHPDVVVLEPGDTGTIKIEQVRDVIDRAQYRPFEGRRRVVVADEADALVPQAQSALLKTLEEPPAASVFLLVSSRPDALLATVRSRCPRLRFGMLSPGEVAAALVRDHGYANADARAAAASADGSIGLALALESVDVTEARATAHRVLQQASRIADPARRMDLARQLAEPAREPRRAGGTKSTGERDRLASCLRALGSLLRDVQVLAVSGDARLLANLDLEGDLVRVAGALDATRIGRAFTAVDRALAALERNANPKIVADWLVLQL